MSSAIVTVLAALAVASTFGEALAAEAVTYRGTIGGLPIHAELVTDTLKPFGRYSYVAKGTDIPLDPAGAGGGLRFVEEAPCTPETCVPNDMGDVPNPPIGADWSLTATADGWSGTWKDRVGGRELPVELHREASRMLDADADMAPQSLSPDALDDVGDPPVLSPERLPYDFRKLDVPRNEGPETTRDGATLRMDTDPRTGVAYPVALRLDGADAAPLNAYLLQGRLQATQPIFACRAQDYAAFGWTTVDAGADNGDGAEGGVPGDPTPPTVSIDHLSNRLVGLTEENSFFCRSAAHPDNYTNRYLADARTGAAIAPESLLAGWTYTGRYGTPVDPAVYDNSDDTLDAGPSETLRQTLHERRRRFDADQEDGCDYDELIAANLGIYFTQDDLVFTLRDLPFAIQACTVDLLRVPLAEAGPFLTARGRGFFPVLDRVPGGG